MTTPLTTTSSGTPTGSGERIEDVDVADEMQGSFLEYAYSVIYSRALPDARDGLKPIQRRILYQMTEMGLRPERGHVKSARVTGEVMGKLHPHGDSSIYDAMVRMTQSFIMRVPLIDGHGNFGSLDDGPAAARYTEARLAPAASAMTADLGELPSVTVPTTYVWSDGDVAIGRVGAEDCGNFVDAPYEFVELSGISHWIPEEAPAALATAILNRICPKRIRSG